ncbi:reverse transcriptase domain-containing protein [Tanacetum coccineum]
MMTATTAFIREETAAASKKKVHTPWKSQDQSNRHTSERRSDFRNQPKDGRGSNKFTPLTRTPKEIFAAESGKFKPPPPIVTLVEKRSSNKLCEFHNDKGHSTDECVQLRKQIEELVREGKLSHFIKEIRHDRDQQKTGKKDAPVKDKAAAIYMIQPSLSPYNGIIGRPEIREIQAVPSTAHGMLKFAVNGGIVTIRSTILMPTEPRDYYWRNGIDQNTNGIMHTLKGKLGYIRMAAVRHDGSTMIDYRASTQYLSRISPIRLKKRGQALERAKAIQVEVQKLVEAGILREVYYHDWLSNPVMVKNHDASWRMCVDFTDLNKACPQDCYPLPEIDWKIESLCGNPFKCFRDAYKGYHQIQMAEQDEEKTAFHTSHGVYCYIKMPFGLKNAGVTYQRLVHKAFDGQIGWNLEIYMDDLVIKSHTETELL